MMEEGYRPTYNITHILFDIDDNIAVLEYEEGVLSIRLFFSIEEEGYNMFLEASNATMLGTFIVKPVLLDDMKTIMFSCETLCSNLRDFRRFFPRCIDLIDESIAAHKNEMKKLMVISHKEQKSVKSTILS